MAGAVVGVEGRHKIAFGNFRHDVRWQRKDMAVHSHGGVIECGEGREVCGEATASGTRRSIWVMAPVASKSAKPRAWGATPLHSVRLGTSGSASKSIRPAEIE